MKRLSRPDLFRRDTKLDRAASALRATLKLGVLMLGLLTAVQVGHAGKPGGSGTTPPVYYDVHILGFGVVTDMNDFGIMVGRRTDT